MDLRYYVNYFCVSFSIDMKTSLLPSFSQVFELASLYVVAISVTYTNSINVSTVKGIKLSIGTVDCQIVLTAGIERKSFVSMYNTLCGATLY